MSIPGPQWLRASSSYSPGPSRAGRKGDSQPLPDPDADHGEDIQSMVIADIEARRQVGIKRYGQALHVNNGRDGLLDAYEEAVDLCVYLKQVLVEREIEAARTTIIEDELSADIPCPNCAVESGNTVFGAVVDGL